MAVITCPHCQACIQVPARIGVLPPPPAPPAPPGPPLPPPPPPPSPPAPQTPEGLLMADVEPSEGTISATSSKLWVVRQPFYLGWGRADNDAEDEDYPDPEPLPQMIPPSEHLPAGWEVHWSKKNRCHIIGTGPRDGAIGSGPQTSRSGFSGEIG